MRGGMEPIIWIAVPRTEIDRWFRTAAGTKTPNEAYYESHAINYVLAHPEKIIDKTPEYTWVELRLGHEKDRGDLRPDVIFQTSKELWIIEVKAFPEDSALERANEQLREYSKRIHELGWWPGKEHRLRVFWTYVDSDAINYELTPWERIPSDKLDFKNKRRRS